MTDAQQQTQQKSSLPNESDLKNEIERLNRELATAQQDRTQSAAFGLELCKERDKLQKDVESIKTLYEQKDRDLQELKEAFDKAVTEQRVSATTVFEKEVQLLNDSDALKASFIHAKQEIEKELKQTKSQLDSAIVERDRYIADRDELTKRVSSLEQERKNLRAELKDLKSRETKLFNENSELEEENVGLQKQVSTLRSAQVEFESSKHEVQRLQDEVSGLNSQLEEMLTLRRITERQMQEALEALQSEREQKYALRKELDKRNSADPLMNWTSIAALKGSPQLANLALRGLSASHRSNPREIDNISPNGYHDPEGGASDVEQASCYDLMHELEMPSIEGSLFDEVHLTEIKKLQETLDEKENQRSNLNTKLIEVQHKLESKQRQAAEIEKKLSSLCNLIEEIYNESDNQRNASSPTAIVTKTTNASNNNENNSQSSPTKQKAVIDEYDNIYSHLQSLFNDLKSYQEMQHNSSKENSSPVKEANQAACADLASLDQSLLLTGVDKRATAEGDTLQSDDIESLKAMLAKKQSQLKILREALKSNKDSAEVALMNLKSKYEIEKEIVAETMSKLRHEHKRLQEDAATFASLRSHFGARIEEYNSEIEKLQTKLTASEHEKNTLNSILRMAIEQKVMLTQKLEALEMDREDASASGNYNAKNSNGQRSGNSRGRAGANRSPRAGGRGARYASGQR